MAFKQQCPSCEAMVLIKDPAQIGKKIECPQCKYRFLVEPQKGADELAADAAKAKSDAAKKPAAPAAKGAPAPAPAKGAPAAPAKGVAAPAAPVAKGVAAPAAPAKGSAVPKKEAPSRTNFDDDDDDEPSPKFKAKKSGGGNVVLVAGIGVAVIALGILGIGGFFLFFSDELGGKSSKSYAIPTNLSTAKTTVVEDNTPRGHKLVDITNLLPGDADGVYHVDSDRFLRSLVGSALFKADGALRLRAIEKQTGLNLDNLGELAIAQSLRQGWLFVAVRAKDKPLQVDAITKSLGLKPAPEGPIKKQEYLVTEPSAWLDNMVRLLSDFGGGASKPADASKPRIFAVRFLDKQTLVLADLVPMKAFLESGGNPAPAPKADGKLTTKPSNHFLTVKAPLKAVLDRVETKPILFSAAWDMTAFKDTLGRTLRALGELKILDPRAVAEVDDLHAVGLSLHMQENSVFTLCLDSARAGLGKEVRTELHGVGEMIARSGSLVEFDKEVIKPPPPPPGAPPLPPRPSFFFKTFPEEKPAAFTMEVQQPRPGGNSMLLNELLKPQMLILSGIADMAREQPPLLTDLRLAMSSYSTENKAFPPGTADRKSGSLGRPYPPSERVSWMVELLPHMGRDDVFKAIDPLVSWRPEYNAGTRKWNDTNTRMGAVLIPGFLDPTAPPQTWWVQLPSMPLRRFGATHFVGMAGVGLDAAEYKANDPAEAKKMGVFGYYRQTKLEDIKNGLANTIVTIQVPPTYKRPWIAGGGATVMGVPEKNSIAPFVCVKRGDRLGTHVLMADGSVRFIGKEIPDEVFKAMCTINAGDKVDLDSNSTLVTPAKK